LTTFPSFNITGNLTPGNNVTVQLPTSVTADFIKFQFSLHTVTVPIDEKSQVTIPDNAAGPLFVLATSSNKDELDQKVQAGPVVLLVETNGNGTAVV
jgi:hypothetical protein